MKSRLVILDANVIIEAFRNSFWNGLVSHCEIYVPSIVLHTEVYHYQDDAGQKVLIDLISEINQGRIQEIVATCDEMAALEDLVNPNFMDRIDDGEKEALALLLTGRFDGHRYCTGDLRAIKALASLDLGAYGISLEELLSATGQKYKLPHPSYSKAVFNQKRAEGLQEQSLFIRVTRKKHK